MRDVNQMTFLERILIRVTAPEEVTAPYLNLRGSLAISSRREMITVLNQDRAVVICMAGWGA
jgi:hypothetical protein